MLTSFMIRYEFSISGTDNVIDFLRDIAKYVVFAKYGKSRDRIEIICRSEYEVLRMHISITRITHREYYYGEEIEKPRILDLGCFGEIDVETTCISDIDCREIYSCMFLHAEGEIAIVIDTTNSDNLQRKLQLLKVVINRANIHRVLLRPM